VSQGSLLLAPRSVLLLDGPGIQIKNLRVDGALVVKAVPGARVVIDGLSVSNAGWSWTPLEQVRAGVARRCWYTCGCLFGWQGLRRLRVSLLPQSLVIVGVFLL
jgi:hypothetical protein